MSHRSSRALIILTAAVLLLAVAPSVALAATVAGGGGYLSRTSTTVIVQVKDASHMASVRTQLEKSGAVVTKTYRWNAYLVTVPTGVSQTRFSTTASEISGVKYAQENHEVHALETTTTSDPQYSKQWGLPDIGTSTAWTVSQGSGVSVAVIDTGIDASQSDLSGRVVLYKNYVDTSASAADDNDHGTHVAGIIAANRNNGVEGCGTAPKATVYAFKVLDASGSGDEASVAQAIRDAVDYTPCKIISMSLGSTAGDGVDPVLTSAVTYAESKGALVIAAAGNDGVTTASYPAAISGVIGVGAVDSSNVLASWSNYGSLDLDVVAPGVNILSTVRGSTMESWSGTSMATPFVSGAAALVWSAYPSLTATQVASVLESTAKDLGTTGTDKYYGYGLVRPDLALAELAASAETSTSDATSSTITTTETPTPTSTASPVTTSTLTLSLSATSIRLNKTTRLSGVLKPGAVGDVVKVDVMVPGSTKWTFKFARHITALTSGLAKWSYTFKATKRGTYKVRARYLGTSTRSAVISRTLKLLVKK
jgi:subtilisin family serine protease